MDDYYKILQVDKNATENEIKKSYRKLAKKFHPDQNPDNKNAQEIFSRLNDAYEVLVDKDKRAAYDSKIATNAEFAKSSGGNKHNREKSKTDFNFTGSGNIFEDFFGFNPNSSDKKMDFKEGDVQPMKTKDAYDKIFGKGRFR